MTELLIVRGGWRLDIDADEPVDDLVVGVVERTISLGEAHAWFRDRLRRA